MKLYGSYTSPYVRHCRALLDYFQLSYELVPTDQSQSHKLVATKRVPFLQDGDISLTDSASIIRYIREKAGSKFCKNVIDLDQFCLVNTALDSAANLFYLEKFGLDPSNNDYTQRQQERIYSTLDELEKLHLDFDIDNDACLRLACFIDWALFRHLLDFDNYPRLLGLLGQANDHSVFAQTQPNE